LASCFVCWFSWTALVRRQSAVCGPSTSLIGSPRFFHPSDGMQLRGGALPAPSCSRPQSDAARGAEKRLVMDSALRPRRYQACISPSANRAAALERAHVRAEGERYGVLPDRSKAGEAPGCQGEGYSISLCSALSATLSLSFPVFLLVRVRRCSGSRSRG